MRKRRALLILILVVSAFAGAVWWQLKQDDKLAALRPFAIEEHKTLVQAGLHGTYYRLEFISLKGISHEQAAERIEKTLWGQSGWSNGETLAGPPFTRITWARGPAGADPDEQIALTDDYALDYSGRRELRASYMKRVPPLMVPVLKLFRPRPPGRSSGIIVP